MSAKIDLRTYLEIRNSESTTEIELFKNQTLRPILKLQNDLYVLIFKNFIVRQKVDFNDFTMERRKNFIAQSLQKDVALKNTLIGIILGMFTEAEMETYFGESKEFNKRIITMLIERIIDQIM